MNRKFDWKLETCALPFHWKCISIATYISKAIMDSFRTLWTECIKCLMIECKKRGGIESNENQNFANYTLD